MTPHSIHVHQALLDYANFGGPKRFGLLLRKQRIALGLTQADAAACAGIAQPAYHILECGGFARSPRLKTLRRLSIALGISVEVFQAVLGTADESVPGDE